MAVAALDLLVGEVDGSTEAVGKLFGSTEALGAVFQLTGAQADSFRANLLEMEGAAGTTDEAYDAFVGGLNASGQAWHPCRSATGGSSFPLTVPAASPALRGLLVPVDGPGRLSRATGAPRSR